MKNTALSFCTCMILVGCSSFSAAPPKESSTPFQKLPDINPAAQLPEFREDKNQVEISSGLKDVDPTFILGAIVDAKSGVVRNLDNFLTINAKPSIVAQSDVVFDDFVENSLAASASWLAFLSAQVSNDVKAEVTVTKVQKVTITPADINRNALVTAANKMSPEDRANSFIIIGYVDFLVSSSLFKSSAAGGSVTGYGAQIGGKWYSKNSTSSAHHKLIAITSSLPLTLQILETYKTKNKINALKFEEFDKQHPRINTPPLPKEISIPLKR